MALRSSRNLLILFFLALAAVQIVRVDFFVNQDYIGAHAYAEGHAAMPYQGRVLMVPILHAAEESSLMQHAAEKYSRMITAGSHMLEPMTAEKFASMLASIVALWMMVAGAAWYGLRRLGNMWWLVPCLTLAITAVTVDLHSEHNIWYPYDLPHAAFFGLAMLAALQRKWMWAWLLYALDVPTRETAFFLLPTLLVLFWLNGGKDRQQLLLHQEWSKMLQQSRTKSTVAIAVLASVYWLVVRSVIYRHYAGLPTEVGQRAARNLHELCLPHHWPQMLSAGGYLAIFIFLERKRLGLEEKVVLWGSLLCVPVVLYFSIWAESRVWVEWTLPLAALAAVELTHAFRSAETQDRASSVCRSA